MLLFKLVQIFVLLILALYALASLLPDSLDSLRQISSPIFVFALLNASIFLLSLARFSPTLPDPTQSTLVPADSIVASLESPTGGAEIDNEFERIEAAKTIGTAVADESRSEEVMEKDCTNDVDETEQCVEMAEQEEEEVVEELSNEEFNRIVEAFLEKQKRFHYQENITILA